MENNLTIHLKMFNDKVKLMNQMNSKDLILSANEARNLHADLFDLLNHCATLSRSEERRVGKECRSECDWSSDVCSSDLINESNELKRPHFKCK